MHHPMWLKVVCIGSIVLGGWGGCTSVSGTLDQFLAESMQQSMLRRVQETLPKAEHPAKDLVESLVTEMLELQRRWRPINLALAIIHLVVASCLLTGGVLALRRKPAGRKLLLAAAASAAMFEVVQIVPSSIMQWQAAKLTAPYLQRFADVVASASDSSKLDQNMLRVIAAVTEASALMRITAALGMMLIKLAFYLATVWLLRQPHIRALYSGQFAVAEVVH